MVAGTVVVLLVGAAVVMALALGAGMRAPAMDIDDADMAAARQRATTQMDTTFDRFAAHAGLLDRLGGPAWKATCEAGRYDWKIKDPKAFTCTVEVVRVYASSEDFAAGARAVVEALEVEDCSVREQNLAAEHLERDLGTASIDQVVGGPGPCASWNGEGLVVGDWAALPLAPTAGEHGTGMPRPCSATEQHCRSVGLDLDVLATDPPDGATWLVVVTNRTTYATVDWERSFP